MGLQAIEDGAVLMYDAVVTCIPEDTPRGGIEDFWNAMRKQMQPGAFAFIVMPNTNQLDLAYLTVGLAEAGWETGFTTTLHADVDSERYIVAAMVPPSEKTYVNQALTNGKGITWLDDCRVPTAENLNGGAYSGGERPTSMSGCTGEAGGTSSFLEAGGGRLDPSEFSRPEGRFPANLLIQDDRLNDGVQRKSGDGNVRQRESDGRIYGGGKGLEQPVTGNEEVSYGDSGSASRFFDLDAVARKYGWSKEEALPLYLITLSTRPGATEFDPFDSIVGLPEKIDRERAGL
jgi:hypothetical protein